MLSPDHLKTKFDAALPYEDYVATGDNAKQDAWNDFHAGASLTDAQRTLISGFQRRMPVLVSSGVWCGDCVQQCPLLDLIAQANDKIELRFVDRDEHSDLAEQIQICGGMRVPIVLFLNEDYDLVSFAGDRSLSRYRAMAARQLGASCPLPGAPVPADEVAATLQDWVDEFERAQLICRTSTKLRQRHGD
ncbi:MAG: thioredoxin family protein [Planctomycetota bacterium]